MFLLVLALASLLAAGYVVLLAPRRALRAAVGRAATYGRPRVQQQRRVTMPGAVATLARLGMRVLPRTTREGVSAQLAEAGVRRIDADTYVAGKTFAAATGTIFALLLGASGGNAGVGLLLALLVGSLAFVGPDFVLKRRARERRDTMLRDLPSALDLLAVSVEAGLGIDGAVARYAESSKGPLAEEFARVVAEMRVGGSRREVMSRLADRLAAPEVIAFVRAVAHADQLGVGFTGTLRSQADEARRRRQALAEERAGKMPVKMLIPTVFLIFPALFIVLLGPAVLNIVSALGHR